MVARKRNNIFDRKTFLEKASEEGEERKANINSSWREKEGTAGRNKRMNW